MDRRGIVYIAQDLDERGERRDFFSGHWELPDPPTSLEHGPGWTDAEEALAWGRERAPVVLVRLGSQYYSAGDAEPEGKNLPRWPPAESELSGGGVTSGVVRVGDTVRRPVGPWTPTIHAYLRHLEERGFGGAPRVAGIDERGREILTYVEGLVPSDSDWQRGHATPLPEAALSDESLVEAGRLIRALHAAAADFQPTEPVWREYVYPALPGEIACHGDLGPHNTVYRDGRPVAFIDWDGARPNEPVLEFAHASWYYVPLADDAYCEEMGFREPPDRAARLRLFAEAYGAPHGEVVDALREAKQREAERLRYWPVTAGSAAQFLSQLVRELEWLAANEPELHDALGSR